MTSSDAPSDLSGTSLGERKLVAVLYADMVGYSRLIGVDDAGTLARLKRLRTDLIDPAINEHRGRIVQTGGDSLLVVFDSIDGAVRCAVKVQRQVPIHDKIPSPDHAIRFRMGIDIGDAIADGTELHGDGVIVAARLQAECPPGDVCVSRAVRDHVHDRLDLTIEPLGLLNLKNIARPVDAFLLRPTAVPKSVERALVQGASKALPLPDKPSIAVLAFSNMSGDMEHEYFSDGIADDIITELSRSRSLFVISRNSSFTYKGRSVDVRRAARELGVRYVLEGSVRRSGGRVRVAAQLIHAEVGDHIWAERYDRDVHEVFAVQDEISAAVADAILPAVSAVERQKSLRKMPEDLGAWEAYQRGLWHMSKCTEEDNELAQRFFARALALDRLFSPAHTALAQSIAFQHGNYGSLPFDEAIRLGMDHARAATEIDPDDAEAQAMLATMLWGTGNYEAAWERTALALANNPNSPWATSLRGGLLIFSGQPKEGRDYVLAAIRLSPHDPRDATVRLHLAVSYYFEHDYAAAAEMARSAIARHPGAPAPYRWLAASLGQLGQEAEIALKKAIEASPRSFEQYVRSRPAWARLEDYEHMLEGLRKAGWQG
jgi:adenylate cyclase